MWLLPVDNFWEKKDVVESYIFILGNYLFNPLMQ